MRTCAKSSTVPAVVLAVAAALAVTGAAGAADQNPAYTCQAVLEDDINRVAGEKCAGGPAGYEGAGSIKDAASGAVWECGLLGSAADPESPGKATDRRRSPRLRTVRG